MNFVGSEFIDLDLLTTLTAGLFLIQGTASAAIFAFAQGLAIDLFSGGAKGLFALIYLSVFGGILLGSQYINLQNWRGQILLVSLAVLLKKILFIVILEGFYPDVNPGSAFLWISSASLVLTGLTAPLVILSLDRLWKSVCARGEDDDHGEG